MKVDFAQAITNLENKPIKETEDKELTLGAVSASCLLAQYQDEQNLSGDDKVKRFKLAEKIYAGGEQDISVEEAALLKKLIAKAYTPLIVGRAYSLIEKE